MDTLSHKLREDHTRLQTDANLLFSLRANTETNTDLIGRLFDMQDVARKTTEYQYRRRLEERKGEHEEERENMREQYEYLLAEEERKRHMWEEKVRGNKVEKSRQVESVRGEMAQMYGQVREQEQLINNVEDGVYTQGFHSHYVPPA